MITKGYLSGLSHEENDAIILRQAHEIEKLKVQTQELINALEKLVKSKKTSKNSSTPSSKNQKENRPEKEKKVRKKLLGLGFSRALHANPHE
jgi:hypothetical protein